ncbi:MAG TPA: class I tRNA ligase family protein, partial [Roseiflexaceae bacterium]|nr:class I tRNA ligase family protein [Roseiflexaceae bacterium]
RKEGPLDFILWQGQQPGEPAWESPWGPGRPGWHIECSAMAMRYLGPRIDVHGGGSDLTFPHHPSEIAQTEAHTGKVPFARFWMHGGLAFFDGEKMSKSLGNLVLIRDALRRHSANAVRWYLLSFPYRADFNYVTAEVEATEAKVARLRAALHAAGGSGTLLDTGARHSEALTLIDNDLQTEKVLLIVEGWCDEILAAAAAGQDVASAQAQLREIADIVGFQLTSAWPA